MGLGSQVLSTELRVVLNIELDISLTFDLFVLHDSTDPVDLLVLVAIRIRNLLDLLSKRFRSPLEINSLPNAKKLQLVVIRSLLKHLRHSKHWLAKVETLKDAVRAAVSDEKLCLREVHDFLLRHPGLK